MQTTTQTISRCSCIMPRGSPSTTRTAVAKDSSSAGNRRKILVPIDRSFHPALSAAIALASATGSQLVVLHVEAPSTSVTDEAVVRAEPRREEADHVLAAAAAMMPEEIKAEYYECYGDPADQIVHFASQWAPEMIVMGLRPEGPSDVFPGCKVLGSVLRQTHCPVMLVRHLDADSTHHG